MLVQCGWCGKPIGEKSPLEDHGISHGICAECRVKYQDGPPREVYLPRKSREGKSIKEGRRRRPTKKG